MDLKPCPFCGGRAILADYGSKDEIFITDQTYDSENGDNPVVCCSVCGAEVSQSHLPSKLAEQWNTRKPEELAAEKRRFAERLFFELMNLADRKEGFNRVGIKRLLEHALESSEYFFQPRGE